MTVYHLLHFYAAGASPEIVATNFIKKFKKFCKGVQGKKLFQKFFPCIEKLQDLLEML